MKVYQSITLFLLMAKIFLLSLATTSDFLCEPGQEEVCSLNGVCSSTNSCICDPGWEGKHCQYLKLQSVNPNTLGYRNVSMPTWGGDMLFEDGKWHLFITSRADQSTPYDSYSCNVDIKRLEGPSPIGPFRFVETVLSRWHHEVHAIKAPDGTVLLYMIKYDGKPASLNDTMPETHSSRCGENSYNKSHQVMALAWSKSVYGPWQEKVIFNPYPGPVNRTSWHCQTNCPSAAFASNGSVVMAYRAVQCEKTPKTTTKEKIVIATAPHWSGPYTQRTHTPIFGWRVPSNWPNIPARNQTMANEDPFIWRTQRGWHMLLHGQLPPNHQTRGALAYSKNALDWTLLPYDAWSANVTWTSPWAPNSTVNPSLSTQMFRRQAPSLHVNKEGQPLALLTPVDHNPGDGIHWHSGWTLIQKVKLN